MILCCSHNFNDWSDLWAFLTAIATITLAWIAYSQLNKLRSTNNTQILVHLEDEWNSNSMKIKRVELATYIKSYNETSIEERNYDKINLHLQPVFDFIEKIALLTNEGNFELKWVFHLYSYALQNYWELATNIGYLDYIRKFDNGNEFYDQYEILYNKLINKYKLSKSSADDLSNFIDEEINLNSTNF